MWNSKECDPLALRTLSVFCLSGTFLIKRIILHKFISGSKEHNGKGKVFLISAMAAGKWSKSGNYTITKWRTKFIKNMTYSTAFLWIVKLCVAKTKGKNFMIFYVQYMLKYPALLKWTLELTCLGPLRHPLPVLGDTANVCLSSLPFHKPIMSRHIKNWLDTLNTVATGFRHPLHMLPFW